MLRHAYDTVPFYRQSWDDAGVHPTDVRDFADLMHFPVVTKTDIRTRGQTDFVPIRVGETAAHVTEEFGLEE